MIRAHVALCFAGLFLLCGCEALNEAVSARSQMDLLRQRVLDIAAEEPRHTDAVQTLITALEETLDLEQAVPSGMGDTLHAHLERVDDSLALIAKQRKRLTKLTAKVVDNWSTQVAFLPQGHPWRDLDESSDSISELQARVGELDELLGQTEGSLRTAVTDLRAPIDGLRGAQGLDAVEQRREALVQGLTRLAELPDRFARDAAALRDFAATLTQS